MHVALACPCGTKLKTSSKNVGRQLNCPKCGTALIVPEPPTAIVAGSQPAPPVQPQVTQPGHGQVPIQPMAPIDPLTGLPMQQQMMPQQGQPMQQQYPPQYGQPMQQIPGQMQPMQPVPGQMQPPQMMAPGYAQPVGQAKPKKQKQKQKRKTSWVVIAVAVGVGISIFGGVLFYLNSSERSKIATEFKKDLRNMNPNGPIVSQSNVPPQRRDPVTREKNRFDSGGKDFRAVAGQGSAAELALADLIEKVEPSIVRLKVTGYEGDKIGSGFFIGSEGKIATNFHVVDEAIEIEVATADGKKTQALGFLVATPQKDLAIIQIDPAKLNVVPIAIAQKVPRKGEVVAAFGCPRGFDFSTTEGIVSSVRSGQEVQRILRDMNQVDAYSMMGFTPDTNWIQTSVAISGGNSGGPLVNMKGEVVGINTWTHPGGQNLNFASTYSELEKLYGKRGDLLQSFSGLPPSTSAFD